MRLSRDAGRDALRRPEPACCTRAARDRTRIVMSELPLRGSRNIILKGAAARRHQFLTVMPRLSREASSLKALAARKRGWPGTSPAMTERTSP